LVVGGPRRPRMPSAWFVVGVSERRAGGGRGRLGQRAGRPLVGGVRRGPGRSGRRGRRRAGRRLRGHGGGGRGGVLVEGLGPVERMPPERLPVVVIEDGSVVLGRARAARGAESRTAQSRAIGSVQPTAQPTAQPIAVVVVVPEVVPVRRLAPVEKPLSVPKAVPIAEAVPILTTMPVPAVRRELPGDERTQDRKRVV